MFTISKTFSFCYGHRLMNDRGKCRHLHGHSARATFVLDGASVDERGMLLHFDRMKETVGKWIEENLDHTLLLAEADPAAKALAAAGEIFRPLPENPTAENIARMLFAKAEDFGLPVRRVEVWESETAMAAFGKER